MHNETKVNYSYFGYMKTKTKVNYSHESGVEWGKAKTIGIVMLKTKNATKAANIVEKEYNCDVGLIRASPLDIKGRIEISPDLKTYDLGYVGVTKTKKTKQTLRGVTCEETKAMFRYLKSKNKTAYITKYKKYFVVRFHHKGVYIQIKPATKKWSVEHFKTKTFWHEFGAIEDLFEYLSTWDCKSAKP